MQRVEKGEQITSVSGFGIAQLSSDVFPFSSVIFVVKFFKRISYHEENKRK